MKKDRLYIIIFILGVILILGIITLPEKIKENKANKCEICHENEKMDGKSYCWSCYMNAYTKVINQNNSGKNKTSSTYNKNTSSAGSGSSSSTYSSTSSTSNYSKNSSSSSSKKKDYSDLEFDPIDYDDPDDYAEDAWEIDFDDYDDAYDYWEDY